MKKEAFRTEFLLYIMVVVITTVASKTQFNITRHYQGDVFSMIQGACPADLCFGQERRAIKIPWASCECQCTKSTPVFRQDLEQCVNNIHECGPHMASFVGPSFSETVPLVFLPRKDGLIYPTAEVSLTDPTFKAVGPNICVLEELKVLEENGWKVVEHLTNDGPSFKAVGGAGKLFLQFSGDDAIRQKLFGNVVIVSVVCHREFASNQQLAIPHAKFEYCIAFRVAHLPGFEIDGTPPARGSDYVIIGLCAGLLGVTYVGAVLIYLLVRWQRRYKENRKSNVTNEENPGESGRNGGKSVMSNGHVVASSEIGPTTVDPQTALISDSNSYDTCQPRLERAPFKGLHIETIASASSEHATDGRSPHPSMQKRRLYFDPSFLDPDVLDSPPPAALEFLQRIREMIAVTTSRIRNNRFLPSLLAIPEETMSIHSSRSSSPRPPLRKNSSKGKSIKEGVENEAFHLDEEEESKPKNQAKNHIYSWISEDDEDGNDKYDQSKFKVQADNEKVPFAMNPNAGAVEDDDRFMFLARIPEDGELTDSFDGLYDFESFRQEMVKKMQKKRRNQLKPTNGSGSTLEANGELSEHGQNGEGQYEEWSEFDSERKESSESDDKTQLHSLDVLQPSDSSSSEGNGGSSSFPKVSRIQILQRMFQGENSDNSGSDKSDSDTSFDSIPTTNENRGLLKDGESKRKDKKSVHNEKLEPSPKTGKKPLATYLFGETLLKVAKCKNDDSSFSESSSKKNSGKYAAPSFTSSSSPPKIERLKRKAIGNSSNNFESSNSWDQKTIDASVGNKSDKANEKSEFYYSSPRNFANEPKKCHKQIVLVNGHNDAKITCQPEDGKKPSLFNGSVPLNNPNSKVISGISLTSAKSSEHIYDNPVNFSLSDSPIRQNGLKHFPEDSGYQSSDSDQSNKGITNRFGNRMKSLRKLLTISAPKVEQPVIIQNPTSSFDHSWSSGEGLENFYLKYGAVEENKESKIPNGYANGNHISKIVSTLESSMELGTEDEEDYKGNSSDSEYADSLDGSTAVR